MELYVFPLGQMLLYPSISKPLHIEEPKYIRMVEDSIAQGVPIAIGYVDEPDRAHNYRSGEDLSFVRSIVGYGFPSIVDRKPDGSLLVFLHGIGKAKLGPVKDLGRPYIVCEATTISENLDIRESSSKGFLYLQKVLFQWMNSHIPDPNSRMQFMGQIQSPQEVVGCYAAYLLADHDMKQLILETNDINEKIGLLNRLVLSGEIV